MKCVELIIVDPYNLELYEDEWYHEAYADVYPEDAACRCVTWHSDNPSVASVNAESGYIHAEAPGTANIYATACDGSGVSGVCHVTVKDYIPVTNVVITPASKTLGVGDTFDLNATIYPENSTDKFLIWSSSDPRIATVDPLSGEVTAIALGKTIITVKTYDDEKRSTCVITVTPDNDTREKVSIKKYDDYFEIIFPDNTIWKSFGCDLSENRSGEEIWLSENWDSLTTPEKNYLENDQKEYTAEQLAFIYLCDPLGVEFYLKNYSWTQHETSLIELLKLKDNTFKEIFGCMPRLFEILPDKTVSYYSYIPNITDTLRENLLSDAEVMFGGHSVVNWYSWVSFGLNATYAIVTSCLSIAYPPAGSLLLAADFIKYLFFNGAIEDIYTASTSEIVENYINEVIETSNTKKDVKKLLSKRLKWTSAILNGLSGLVDASSVFFTSLNDLRIYNKINSAHFKTSFIVDGVEMTMQEFLSHCECES